MLSADDRQLLIEHPDAFIQQRVQALFDPFSGFSLVPSQDDWLGLTGRIQNSQPQHGSVQLDIGSGALIADADGKSWVLLRARTTGNAFDMKLPLQVADLLQASRTQAGEHGAQLLAASGLLYAANGQQQATREITWVGGGATVGILLLLLLAFRRWRVLLAFVPVLVGMLFGAVACVALFGRMHVMTLVLGSSLIGVAVDYPLHYLSKSWSLKPWHSWPAVSAVLPRGPRCRNRQPRARKARTAFASVCRRTGAQLPAAAFHILPGRLAQLGEDAAAVQVPRHRGGALPAGAPERHAVHRVPRDQVQHAVGNENLVAERAVGIAVGRTGHVIFVTRAKPTGAKSMVRFIMRKAS